MKKISLVSLALSLILTHDFLFSDLVFLYFYKQGKPLHFLTFQYEQFTYDE